LKNSGVIAGAARNSYSDHNLTYSGTQLRSWALRRGQRLLLLFRCDRIRRSCFMCRCRSTSAPTPTGP